MDMNKFIEVAKDLKKHCESVDPCDCSEETCPLYSFCDEFFMAGRIPSEWEIPNNKEE